MNEGINDPGVSRTDRSSPLQAWIAEHSLSTLCLVAVASGGLVFAVMKRTEKDNPNPHSTGTRSSGGVASERRAQVPNGGSTSLDFRPASREARDPAVADLESKVRILEQNLSLLRTQEQTAQLALVEERKAKQASDRLLLDQEPQISALRQQLEELTRRLATNDQATLAKETLDSLVSQTARQRVRFNLAAHRIWRGWLDMTLAEVDRDTAGFVDRLGKGMAYNEAVAEFSKLKANHDRFIQFADGNAVLLANVLVAVENEMWRRFTQRAFDAQAAEASAGTIGADIRVLSDWDRLLQDSPDRGQRNVQDWLRDLTSVQSSFYARYFDDRTGVGR